MTITITPITPTHFNPSRLPEAPGVRYRRLLALESAGTPVNQTMLRAAEEALKLENSTYYGVRDQ